MTETEGAVQCRQVVSRCRLKESGAINKSLFVLGEVVDAINNNLVSLHHCVQVIVVMGITMTMTDGYDDWIRLTFSTGFN